MPKAAINAALKQVDPRLRLATSRDVRGVERLLGGLNALEWPDLPSQLTDTLGKRLDTTNTSFVAILVHEGRILGAAAMHMFPDLLSGSSQLFVDDIIVNLPDRGKGLGTLLMDGIHAIGRVVDAATIFIHLDARDRRAQAVMKRGALVPTGDRVHAWTRT